MTARELRQHLNETFSTSQPPKTFEVDLETYEHVESAVLEWLVAHQLPPVPLVGPHGGILFRGIELLVAHGAGV